MQDEKGNVEKAATEVKIYELTLFSDVFKKAFRVMHLTVQTDAAIRIPEN